MYNCDDGYETVNPLFALCMANKSWSRSVMDFVSRKKFLDFFGCGPVKYINKIYAPLYEKHL